LMFCKKLRKLQLELSVEIVLLFSFFFLNF